MADPSVVIFGPLDTTVGPYMEYVLLVLAVSNLLTRKLAFDSYRKQAQESDGDEGISRNPLHVVTTWGLLLASFYYLTLHHHSGMVISVLALGLFLTDFFEFEARKVEARNDMAIDAPKGSLVASSLVLLYAAYISVFPFVAPLWNDII
ncbi:hypothetical protein ACFQH6_06960 [Halobacteriaceae archaeon GCM10025711]